jgi:Protein of unknown function DUF131.
MASDIASLLIFSGILVIMIGFVIMLILQMPKGQTKGGAVLLIGPVPIIAGNDSKVLLILMILAIIIILIWVVF